MFKNRWRWKWSGGGGGGRSLPRRRLRLEQLEQRAMLVATLDIIDLFDGTSQISYVGSSDNEDLTVSIATGEYTFTETASTPNAFGHRIGLTPQAVAAGWRHVDKDTVRGPLSDVVVEAFIEPVEGNDKVTVDSMDIPTFVTGDAAAGFDNTVVVGNPANSAQILWAPVSVLPYAGNASPDVTLIVEDSGGQARDVHLTDDSITGFGGFFGYPINYNASEVKELVIITGPQADVFSIDKTAGFPVTIRAGTGDDEAILANTTQTLDDLRGDLAFHGIDRMIVNDSANTFHDAWTLTSTSVDRDFFNGSITFDADLDLQLEIVAGSGNNAFNIESATGTWYVRGGMGEDSFHLGPNLDQILANVDCFGGEHADSLIVNDTSNSRNEAWTIRNRTVHRSSMPGLIIYENDIESLTVNAGTGNNPFLVQSTSNATPVAINTGDGDDVIDVGEGTLTAIESDVTVDGEGGANDALRINDQKELAPSLPYTVASTTVRRFKLPTISYRNLESLQLNTGDSPDEVNVIGTARLTSTSLDTGDGEDSIQVGYHNTLKSIRGPLHVVGNKGNADALSINDQQWTSAEEYTLDGNTFNRTSLGQISFDAVESLALNAGSGGNAIAVQGTVVPTTINAGTGVDAINVGSPLSNIAAPLTVNGQNAAGNDTLTFNDSALTNPGFAYTLLEDRLDRAGAASISFAKIKNLVLNATHWGNTINVHATRQDTLTTINAGGESDFITIGDPSLGLDAISGDVAVHGGGDFSGIPGFRGDVLTINDQGAANSRSYEVAAYQMRRRFAFQFLAYRISYDTVEELALHCDNFDSTIDVIGAPANTQVRIFALGGNDSINVGDAVSSPLMLLGGVGNDTINVSPAATGPMTLLGGGGNDLLSGGAGNDTLAGQAGNDISEGRGGNDRYVFDADGPLGQDFVGDLSGLDTLDFSSTTNLGITLNLGITTLQNVNANLKLQLGAANALEHAMGTSQGDSLTGNALANALVGNGGADTLSGGNGFDLLIGGDGADTLLGGNGGDILIGGRTSNDRSPTALTAILAEWTSANSYKVRRDNLLFIVGLLRVSRVFNDANAPDTLTGGAGLDWFFRSLGDTITDEDDGGDETVTDPGP